MDYTLQKAVELGVSRIVPLACERSVVRLTGERAEKRRQHWQQLVVAACEQCGRNVIPAVADLTRFADGLSVAQGCLALLMDPRAIVSMADLPMPNQAVVLLAGPEGGFSPAEEGAALAAGFTGVRFGPRILRTETAAVAGISLMQGLWGDLAR